MATRTGTLAIADLLAITNQSVSEFGEDDVQASIQQDINDHNVAVREVIADIADVTTDKQRVTGVSTAGEMIEVDEFSRVPTQKSGTPSQVAFPLSKLQFAIGWTEAWRARATPADMAKAVMAAQKAHLKSFMTRFQRAIFGSANYSFTDFLVDGVTYTIKRFANGDGASITDGPNGEVFDGTTHSHYVGNGTLTAAAATALIRNVVEHGYGNDVKVNINQGDEAGWRALTGFLPYVESRVQPSVNTDRAVGVLDITRVDNRAIGIFGGAEVWVKPWVPASYAFAYSQGAASKPLAIREDRAGSMDLRIAATLRAFPLNAEYMEAFYGVAVNTRENGAVLYSASSTYTDPVFP